MITGEIGIGFSVDVLQKLGKGFVTENSELVHPESVIRPGSYLGKDGRFKHENAGTRMGGKHGPGQILSLAS